MVVAVEGCQGNSLGEAIIAEILVAVAEELVVSGTDECEADTQSGQSVELRECAGDDEVVVLVHEGSDVVHVGRDERCIGFIDEHHRVGRNVFHDATNLLACEAVAGGVVGRSQKQHPGMDAVGVSDDFIDVVGKRVACLVEGIHLERTAALASNAVVVPPRELGNQDGLVVALHQEIVDGVLEHLLAAVTQQNLLLGNAVDFTQFNADNTLLSLVVNACIEAQCTGVEVLYCFDDLLGRLEIKFVSVKIVHYLNNVIV